jgi:hypothetical protein
MSLERNFPWIGLMSILGLVSCSDPVPPAAQASVSLHVAPPRSPTTAGAKCTPGPHAVYAPFLTSAEITQQTTATFGGPRAVDGEGSMKVSCSVRSSGSGFDVSGQVTSPAKDAQGMAIQPTSVFISTSLAKDAVDAPGTLRLQDSFTSTAYDASKCKFTVQPAAGEKLAVDSGKIWARVACTELTDLHDVSGSACDVDGYFIFEKCAE